VRDAAAVSYGGRLAGTIRYDFTGRLPRLTRLGSCRLGEGDTPI
jgi:hypothetical protein